MALDDPLLRSALALAATSADGLDALHSLVLTKFIVERIAKLRSRNDAIKAFEALGESQFANAVVLLDERKARTLLKKLDKHFPEIATVGAGLAQRAIVALAAGQQTPHPPPPKALKTTVPTPTLPDMREIYRNSGMDAVHAVVGALPAKELKRLIAEQELKADATPGPGVGAARKYIQLALKAELGSRGDPIGALGRLKDGS
jgi:hypothetical protein